MFTGDPTFAVTPVGVRPPVASRLNTTTELES
jgi:hypothetical protein